MYAGALILVGALQLFSFLLANKGNTPSKWLYVVVVLLSILYMSGREQDYHDFSRDLADASLMSVCVAALLSIALPKLMLERQFRRSPENMLSNG